MSTRLILIITIAVVLGLVLVFAFVGPDAALASEASPSPSASPSATPTPEYASAELVASAMKARKAAVRARERLSRVRRCFRDDMPVRVYPAPNRGALKPAWEKARSRWRGQARGWLQKYRDGRHAMRNPGGPSCGTRWLVLASWVGWPRSTHSQLAYVINRESSGRAKAYNPSGAAGLLQMMPGWYRGQWGIPSFNPFDPEENLRAGYRVWRKCGWSPWRLY